VAAFSFSSAPLSAPEGGRCRESVPSPAPIAPAYAPRTPDRRSRASARDDPGCRPLILITSPSGSICSRKLAARSAAAHAWNRVS
jgi:hypothetical protein